MRAEAMKGFWDKRYQTGDLPWDTGVVDFHLTRILREYNIKPCKVLELGCGSGTNALWLDKQGYKVTAIDFSVRAIELAKEKAGRSKARIKFIAGDVLKTKMGSGFGLAFDRGVFHTLHNHRKRAKLARIVNSHLRKGGMWLSLIGSADGSRRKVGPPQLTALEIISAVEPFFKVISLKASYFGMLDKPGPSAWECFMQKRG
jgi:SAM-dependent methyltransferase